ncbi:unnamed protein product, partial [Ectocarpus sp. 12 AP-2014]
RRRRRRRRLRHLKPQHMRRPCPQSAAPMTVANSGPASPASARPAPPVPNATAAAAAAATAASRAVAAASTASEPEPPRVGGGRRLLRAMSLCGNIASSCHDIAS